MRAESRPAAELHHAKGTIRVSLVILSRADFLFARWPPYRIGKEQATFRQTKMPSGGRRSTSWRPGTCPNPGGRPKRPETIEARRVVADVKAAARELTPQALATLECVMANAKAPPAARVGAATALLDRAWGKPGTGVEISGRLDLAAFRAGLTNLSEVELAELERLLEKADDGEIVQSQGRLT